MFHLFFPNKYQWPFFPEFQTIKKFRDEELEHLHIGEENDADKVSQPHNILLLETGLN